MFILNMLFSVFMKCPVQSAAAKPLFSLLFHYLSVIFEICLI